MKYIFIYDSSIILEKIDLSLFDKNDTVYLFSLTSDIHVTSSLSQKIKAKGCSLKEIQSVQLINSSVDSVRDRYIRFIAGLPEQIKFKGRNLKDIFAIDKQTTLWWFSLISEKNTYKSDAINRLVQLDSIVGLIKREKIEKIIFCCKSEKLEQALLDYSLRNSIEIKVLVKGWLGDFRKYILRLQSLVYLRHVLLLLKFVMCSFLRSWRIKQCFVNLHRDSKIPDKSLLFISPYPSFDIALAQKGVFKNEFYPSLPEALESEEQNIIWAMMYVDNNSISFKESLKFAQDFIRKGYNIFFLEEFNSLCHRITALLTMLTSGLKFLEIEKDLYKAHTFGDYNFYPILKDDWYLSFVGVIGYKSLLYYKMFKSLLSKVKPRKCLYLCEMHAWEKALISARDELGITMPLYGYQSGTIPKMLLNYFNHTSEIVDDKHYCMPRPEKVICNGNLPYRYMKESGWPEDKLFVAEAIRYNYLKTSMKSKCNQKKNVVLLALSISPEESSSILNVAYESLKDLKGVEVWIKAHPFLQIDKVFEMSGIPKKSTLFKIENSPIQDLLTEAKIVIVGQSGVSIEALIHGCEVLIVNTPEWINMSPLKGSKARMVRFVDSAEELKQIVIDILKKADDLDGYALEANDIVQDYFYLNQDSDVPDRFLRLLRGVEV